LQCAPYKHLVGDAFELQTRYVLFWVFVLFCKFSFSYHFQVSYYVLVCI
jgi:hypothetical protein